MMEDDVPLYRFDEYFLLLGLGMVVIDSGATPTIVGEEVWKKWLEEDNFDDVRNLFDCQ